MKNLQPLLETARKEIKSLTGFDIVEDSCSSILIYTFYCGGEMYDYDIKFKLELECKLFENKIHEKIECLSKETQLFLDEIEILEDLKTINSLTI